MNNDVQMSFASAGEPLRDRKKSMSMDALLRTEKKNSLKLALVDRITNFMKAKVVHG